MRSVANFFSFVFHPLLMPLYAMLLIFNLNTYLSYSVSPQLQRIIYIVVFITTFAMPVLFSMLLLQKGVIRSLEMEDKSERKWPFIITSVFYLIAFYLLRMLPVSGLFPLIVLSAAVVILLAFFITIFWKISIHMMGIGGLAGLLWGVADVLYIPITGIFILLIVLAGFIGTARLIRSAHIPSQIYMGFITGFAAEVLFMKFYTY